MIPGIDEDHCSSWGYCFKGMAAGHSQLGTAVQPYKLTDRYDAYTCQLYSYVCTWMFVRLSC